MAEIDPITREIIQNALSSAADEMSLALYRTAYSTIVRDCLDYSTSLCNAQGEMIAQGVTIPLHLGSVPHAMETLLEKYGDDMEPEDVFIMNDPFGGGMHIPDIYVVKPIFIEGHLVSFAVSTAHHLDLGGRLPGSSACDNTEIFQEGFRIPWLKLFHRGEPDVSIFELMRTNVRVPEQTIGDLRAQVAACNIGARAVQALVERHGPQTFADCADDLIAYTERLMRAEIATWPDGSNTFTDYMDSDGVDGPRVRIQVKITVEGDSLTADFTGTDPQGPGCAQQHALLHRRRRRRLCPVRHAGGGAQYRRHVQTPEHHHRARHRGRRRDARGLLHARRDRVSHGRYDLRRAGRPAARPDPGGRRRGQHLGGDRRFAKGPLAYVYYELMTGTWGGRPDRDGNDGLCNPINVASNIPVEHAEPSTRYGSGVTGWWETREAPGSTGAAWPSNGNGSCWKAKLTWPSVPTGGTTFPMDSTRGNLERVLSPF